MLYNIVYYEVLVVVLAATLLLSRLRFAQHTTMLKNMIVSISSSGSSIDSRQCLNHEFNVSIGEDVSDIFI